MSTKIKEIRTTLGKVGICIQELESTIEERESIFQMKLTPSSNDTFELISLLQRIVKYFKYLQDDLRSVGNKAEGLHAEFSSYVVQYCDLYDKLSDDTTIDVREYKFEPTVVSTPTTTKTVRFRDEQETFQEDAAELMGTRPFRPYSDQESDNASLDDVDNRQLFAQHQQTLMRQDQDLDVLHSSIKNQHSMGLTINQELDDHIILLNDLEAGVDTAQDRMTRASARLHNFTTKARENGSLVTICILTVILILLLVVLN
ncbi:uncharacterized protein SPAPADRAFT_59756 [Spathaspora passalidarum NRRL Y-27907]|uniref:t-SNARE coiled-coil homology domain-containing protein n=1 Tax=Spathaspora passalidarum (strain NRRL Y-27907 / 11-Y1) TaxID=619300 RepID=G3AI34_SPAPN|nr:uncharacterized protein SPAPADRAFT_59756 [Spathaspora passalidarum NRRL Y-27907]EGW34348.1 hypothetical protein SPAPADRAFT_59756 [Spathaspora passalidarum NRRL Y-27907]